MTGCTPFVPFLKDFEALETLFADEDRVINHVSIIGGGFLGCEIGVALAKRVKSQNVEVAHIYAEKYPMQRILPEYLARMLQKRFKKVGITPVDEHLVTDIQYDMESGRMVLLIKGWGKYYCHCSVILIHEAIPVTLIYITALHDFVFVFLKQRIVHFKRTTLSLRARILIRMLQLPEIVELKLTRLMVEL